MFFDKNSDIERYNGNLYEASIAFNGINPLSHHVPTRDQQALFWVVHQAVIIERLFYNKDVYDRCVQLLGDVVTEDDLLNNFTNTKTENGKIGMLFYYMRKVVEKYTETSNNLSFLSNYSDKLKVGNLLGKIEVNHKTYSKAEIIDISPNGEVVIMVYGRGIRANKRPTFRVPASSKIILDAINNSA